MKKLMFFITCGIFSLVLSSHANAASFEDMKQNVENGNGLVYNPISDGLMTNESSIQYINILDESIQSSTATTEELMDKAYEKTKNLELVPDTNTKVVPEISTRGANPPSYDKVIYLDTIPGGQYTSEAFSGSGWRYGGYYFSFKNFIANPYFGVSVSGDSFEFRDAYGGYNAVYPNRNIAYYPSYVKGGGASRFGLFRTLNPISGSRYYIY